MRRTTAALGLAMISVLAASGCATTQSVAADSLVFKASVHWQPEVPDHETRLLQYRLPSHQAGIEDATLVVWSFPGMRDTGDGHIINRNMDRWIEQFDLGARSQLQAVRRVEYRINGLPVHTIDIAGRYTAETSPGSGIRYNLSNYRMRGAYVAGPDGDYIIKLVGPANVVAKHTREFDTFVRSVRMGDGSLPQGTNVGRNNRRTELVAVRDPS